MLHDYGIVDCGTIKATKAFGAVCGTQQEPFDEFIGRMVDLSPAMTPAIQWADNGSDQQFDKTLRHHLFRVDGTEAFKIDSTGAVLRKVLSGQEPASFVDGRLWFYDVDKHPYVEEDGVGSKQVALAGDPQPPHTHGNEAHSPEFLSSLPEHGNEAHNPDMLSYFYMKGANYSSVDIVVGSSSPTTLAYYSGTSGKWELPFAGFNYRPEAGNTANRVLEVWWEVPLGTQKSAKFPVTVAVGESKRPFFMFVPFRDVFDQLFWRSKFSATQSIYLRAQASAESVIVSDTYVSGLEISP